MTEEMQYVINSPYTSYWLRDAIHQLLTKDPLDARADAKLLFDLFEENLNEIMEKHKQ